MSEPAFPKPITTVDVVLLTLCEGELAVGLVRRDRAPFAGTLALPGGYVHVDQDQDLPTCRAASWSSSPRSAVPAATRAAGR